MDRKSSKMAFATTLIGLALASSAQAGGRRLTVSTPSLVPDPNGYLYCTVVATGNRPIDMVASILADDGSDVTEFGTGFRASPAVTGDGTYRAEETAGSMADGARSCRARVSGANRGNIEISLTAFDASGTPVATVAGR